MKLHQQMFWSETTKDHPFEYSRKLKRGKLPKEFYVLALPGKDSPNLLELLPSREAMKADERGELQVVVGIAADKGEAMELARVIIDTIWQQTGDLDVRGYFGPVS